MDEKKCPLTYKGKYYTTPGFNETSIANRCIGPECAWWVEDECAITKIAKGIYSAAYGVPESKQ